MYPQQTGWQQQQQQPLYGQQSGFQQQQQQQPGGFARPPLPPQASGQYSFLSAPPPSSSGLSPQQTGWQQPQQPALRQQATGWAGAGLVPQATGWQGAGQQQLLMPQATGWHDPRLQMMQSSFMPMNTSAPFAQSGMPIFQQPSLPAGNLQSSMNLLNQTPSVKTPKIPWALTKDERKNYDQIFRAWDKDGSGFISGEMAREVFGQSGLGQDDMAQIWTLADMDNRGKLNIQEFHVAMALIYRRLNGNDMPAVLPAELVPASSKDLDSNVDFLKSLLRNDTNSRSTSTDPSYAKTRSFNDASPAGGERKKDGTVYKHDEDRELGKTYKSSSRHLDRSSVRTGKESASDDLAQIKRDLANTSSRLDDRLEERGRRDEEDELLDEEMDDLKRRVRRIKDDIEYVSSGRPTSQKDEERRKLERELLHIAHEKIPDVERRIEERDERKKRDEREGVRARDRRNDRYGGRYEDRRDDDDRDRGYRGSYDRENRDYRDRSRDRYDSYGSSSRDRPRSPPPAPAPPAHSLAAPAAPPAPPKPTASPAPVGQTREQRLAEARARALQKLEDRKRALGLGSAEPDVPAVDSSVSERIEREKREAEEAGKRAEEDRAKKEADRRARLEAEKGGPAKPAAAPVPAPPAPPAGGAPAVTPKAAPPPPKPRSILKSRAPAPPPSKAEAPPPPPAATAEEEKEDEEDPVERQLREREERLKKNAADRAARLAALEAQEEEERKAEEAFNARRQQAKSSATSTPPAPKSPEPSSALAVPAAAVAQASTTPTGGSLGSHNPFAKFSAAGGAGTSAAASPAAPDAAKFFKPPTPTFTPPPMAAPVAKAPTKKFVPTPADDEDWDVIEDKGNESDSSDDYDTAKRRKAELAKALFGGIMPSSSPAPSSNPPSAAPTPAPAAGASPTDSVPPKNPMLAALGGGSAGPAARGGLFAAIQGGAKLKKAVTVDKSTPAVTGAVVGDAAPPAHISDVPRALSPPPSPPAEHEPVSANANRQSVDWYAGLAANAPSGASAPTSLPAQVEEDEDEDAHANRQGSQAPVGELDGVDMSVSLRVRTLFSYDGQRPEDLSFTENVMIEAHPASDPESPWYYGTTIKDRKAGWFPSSYVADVADVVQAKALYSYTGSSDQELPFVEGDILTIVEHTDDSWWKAVSDGIVFLVPAAYLDLQGAPAPRDDEASAAEPSTVEVEASADSRPRSASSASLHGSERRAPPPAPPHSRKLSSVGPASATAETMAEENSDASSDSEDDLEEADDDPTTRERRESERLRVLEAAGLRVTVESSATPRPRRARPPPPSAPPRRPQSMVSDGGSRLARPVSVVSTTSSIPPSPAAEEPSPRLEDAYDRYEALLSAQAERPASTVVVPERSSPSLPPSSPTASIGSGVSAGPREGRLSQMMAKISASVAPLAAPEPSKRLSVANISGPTRPANTSPTASSGVTRATTPAAESTSWASLIGDDSILDSLSDKERKRQEAMFEFIATEASYVRDLQLIVGEFYARLVKILDDKELVVIFANVEDILVTSTFMLSELEECQKTSRLYLSSIADILAMHMQNVEIYLPYCSNQGTAIKILQSLREKNVVLGSTLIAMRSEPALRGLDLSTYLLSPMQRITRYPLLLKQIHTYTEPGEDRQKLEMAISEAERVLNRINEQIRARESFDRLAALSQDLWVGSGRLDLTSPTRSLGPRRLLREGKVTKGKGTKRELTVVLTNDILVLIEASRTLYRMPMPLNEISVAEYPSSSSFGFLLVPRYRGDRVLLKTTTAREAAEWVAAIEKAITEERRARLDMT